MRRGGARVVKLTGNYGSLHYVLQSVHQEVL